MDTNKPAAPPAAGHKHAIPVRAISLGLAFAAALYVGMASLTEREAFSSLIHTLPGELWPKLIALSLASYLLRFIRWQRFMVQLQHTIPLGRSLEIYLAAFALTLTPGKAGETIRSLYLHPYGVSYPQSIGAFITERLLDLLAVGTLAALGVAAFTGYSHWVFSALGTLLICVALLRSRLLDALLSQLARQSFGQHTAQALVTIRQLLRGASLLPSILLSLAAWAAQGLSLYLIVSALGYTLPTIQIIAMYCLSILAGAASFIPGGLGTTEAAIALLLATAGVTQSDAITASLVSRGLTLWLAVGIGVLAMTKTNLRHSQPPVTNE